LAVAAIGQIVPHHTGSDAIAQAQAPMIVFAASIEYDRGQAYNRSIQL
jgi:hypothetical protein